ncbi:MAG: long-chain fatty acid--CoA ligase [Richelia sp. RM2_1_2]|nr:long-chain fatty acid--CoA ligase [Richelia sp. SM2_1_7]NJM19500.1 long-chain fatty acid--CoA ligase [Richelia sp. SM1_7_0]NJN09843.1 long-chain fatty acid--CoA ligase [Richelia sp. RM1_1_1]NJO28178.1 long-chain fatty acid--CoA ligase [Richelia sp. SL_2_1]NJO60042.1 long-chain fatty acid--CoA ligase [Richelia sp. RM2_1_2]
MSKTKGTNNLLSKFAEEDRKSLKSRLDYSNVEFFPEIWGILASRIGDTIALHNPHVRPKEEIITYTELHQQIQQFAAGLQALGVKPEQRISLIADNSPRWLIADQGIMTAGAVNAVRSSQADVDELAYILANSDSTVLVAQDLQTFEKLRSAMLSPSRLDDLPIKLVILLTVEKVPNEEVIKVLNYEQLMEIGAKNNLEPVKQNRDALATLLYTSGTSGKPKGVMLSHGNLMHQVTSLRTIVQPEVGDVVLSILPTWHVFERTGEYFLLSQGCTQVYTNLRSIKNDLKTFKPHYMIGVPRIWESIYEGVQKQFREQPASKQALINRFLGISNKYIKARRITQQLDLENLNPSMGEKIAASIQATVLSPIQALAEKIVYSKVREATGGRVKQLISGGGALAKHIDDFYEIIGVSIVVGYGLTETSPVTHARRHWTNLRGSAGLPIPGTQAKIVDLETRQELPTGEKGLVLLKGPQIMQGYYKNPEATQQAIDSEGWFNSGDLGWLTPRQDIVLTGRAKDTIVLTNGENIEPLPVEDACLRSPFIDQIMLVGQDKKSLGALIVPNLEALEKWAKTQKLELCVKEDNVTTSTSQKINLESKMIQDLFRQELIREVRNRPGYRPDDRIGPFKLILEPFSMENGMMTRTLKVRRHVVMESYHDTIERMYNSN